MRPARVLAYLWASPNSAIGLAAAGLTLMTGGRVAVVAGVLEVHGGFAAAALRKCVPLPGGAAAMTLGHVVLGVDAQALHRTRAHERVHVRQSERWGPAFIPAYLLASLPPLLAGRDAYHDNPFEREARGE